MKVPYSIIQSSQQNKQFKLILRDFFRCTELLDVYMAINRSDQWNEMFAGIFYTHACSVHHTAFYIIIAFRSASAVSKFIIVLTISISSADRFEIFIDSGLVRLLFAIDSTC